MPLLRRTLLLHKLEIGTLLNSLFLLRSYAAKLRALFIACYNRMRDNCRIATVFSPICSKQCSRFDGKIQTFWVNVSC